jgi:hypothetical protein
MVKRSKLVPMMQLFDAPEPLVSVGNRPSTTIAPQALLFMNNAQVRGYARSFSRRVLREEDGGSETPTAEQWKRCIARCYAIALGRSPTKQELSDNLAFLQSQAESYAKTGKADAAELALADVCQVLMSLNEFVYVE